jgi:dTDP-4-dehydrorhamnose reductase
VLDHAGWWHRRDRYYQPLERESQAPALVQRARTIAIAGATGTLGRAFARICGKRGLAYTLLSRSEMDITNSQSINAALELLRPWAVINAAGYVRVDQAEHDEERCFLENAQGAEMLARACSGLGIQYVAFSSDLVFDGRLGRAYVESDKVCPTGVYGRSKATAERLVQEAFPDALVVRTSAFFGPWDHYNFIHVTLQALNEGRRVEASDKVVVSPTYVPDLVHASLDLLIDRSAGVWHLTNQGVSSWHELAARAASAAGISCGTLVRAHGVEASATPLSSERGLLMPTLEGALRRYVKETALFL